jgi:sulfate-transporting ATPase
MSTSAFSRKGNPMSGPTVQLAYVDQSRESLDPEKTIWEVISNKEDVIQFGSMFIKSRAYVARFNFTGSDQQKKVGMLSGGDATAYTWPACSSRAPT